ncbi:ABC transporter ATP-binding protein [Micromonospora sp. NPDC049559]|uniref:ABC transporter ATP-binding protein n=1 Tax=Micromonospora sp. NPDC049559 TaxID=3155923 RepID=UPI0034161807
MSELRFEQVTVRFGRRRHALTAVDRVDLTVPAGSVVGLVGESGSGKSTLARAAVGLTPVSGGRVFFDGQPLRRAYRGEARRPVQLVFQDPYSSLDPRMSVGASVGEAVSRAVRGRAARRAEVARLLELVDLPADHAGRYPAELSGGQRQRVAIARALAARPRVLVADEITSALDVSIQGTVLNLVRDLHRSLRLSMLFISHNLAVVRYVSDFVAVMYLGRIVEFGPVDELLAEPRHPYTRELLAAAPRAGAGGLGRPDADPGPRGGTLDPADAEPVPPAVADAEPADPHRPPSGCRFHPRCPVGPLVHAERAICRTTEPTAPAHRAGAACHFAASPRPGAPTAHPEPVA